MNPEKVCRDCETILSVALGSLESLHIALASMECPEATRLCLESIIRGVDSHIVAARDYLQTSDQSAQNRILAD